MTETDVPKRVVIVLLVLTILISFMGTLAFLQYYVNMPSAGPSSSESQATLGIRLLPPPKAQQAHASESADGAQVSVMINRYSG